MQLNLSLEKKKDTQIIFSSDSILTNTHTSSRLMVIWQNISSQETQALGFPQALLMEMATSLLRKPKGIQRMSVHFDKNRVLVVPCTHKVSDSVKNFEIRFGVPVVFSAPQQYQPNLC